MTTIYGESGANEAEGLAELAAVCGLSQEDATSEVTSILAATSQWKSVAARNGCKPSEISLMAAAMQQAQERLRSAFKL